MIMHGTWYKGPQLAHTHHHSSSSTTSSSVPTSSTTPTEYHQFRSYPTFVVAAPYHENPATFEKTFPSAASTPLLVEGPYNGPGSITAAVGSNPLTVLSPTIKIEQTYGETTLNGVDDYALNLVDCSVTESGHFKKPSTNYVWSTVNSESETNNSSIEPTSTTAATTQISTINNTSLTGNAATPPTPPPDTQLSLEHSTTKAGYHNSLKTIASGGGQLIHIANEEEAEAEHETATILGENSRRVGVVSSTTAIHLSHKSTNKSKHSSLANTQQGHSHPHHHHHHLNNSHSHHQHHSTTHHSGSNNNTMPIGGVQGQNPTQGLVHWMSAVMAEHMTGQTHHDPTAVGMHYMWNGNVDHYGQHNKEIGDHNFWPPTPPTTATAVGKTKMNDHHNNLQKGHFIDDNRLDHHAVTPQGGSVLGSSGGGHHGNHVGHHGSAASALLVVPQPINATKIGASLGGGTAGTGRKYQCKMCPQGAVSTTTTPNGSVAEAVLLHQKSLCLDTKLADSTTGVVSSTVSSGGGGRGRKSRIYPPNPNQHIVVTSNSVDNGGTRHHNRQQQQQQQQTNDSNNGISSSTSSPHHPMQLQDIKDTKIFTSKADLQLHTQMHMRESKPYKCTQCSKAFANSSYLSQHTRIHLGIKPYRCEICQRKFTQLSHLQQHIRTHTGDKPYKCRHPGCQKAFSQLSNLQSHSRCHQTDKPFKCNSCYKCFSDEPSLLDHIPKHKESKHLKTHICQYCGKSYTQETYLNKHMQKHAERTDKRPPIVVTNAGNNPAGGTTPAAGAAAGGAASTTTNSTTTNNNTGVGSGGAASTTAAAAGIVAGVHNQHNRNNLTLPPVTIAPTDNSYWPKVSPDSAANLNDVMHQQQQQQQQSQQHHNQHPHQQQQQQHHSGQQGGSSQHHPQQQTNPQQQQPSSQQQGHMDYGNHQQQQQQQQAGNAGQSNNPHNDLQAHHRMNDNGREDIVSTPSTVGPYDASSITKTTTNSAFTPINSMPPHLNTLSHHAMAQRPYLYDAISFQNKNVNQNNASNAFPNQLISLHQIRNYAHQPAGLTMAGEHLLGVSVGPGKDKG